MKWGLWKGRHVPGAQLASDLLTKAVTTAATWRKFYNFMGMANSVSEKEEDSGFSPKIAGVVVCTIAALGAVVSLPDVPQKSKVASALGVAALTAWLVRYMGRRGHKKTAKEGGTWRHWLSEGQLRAMSKKDARGKMNPGLQKMVSGKMNRHQILE